jgi:hypothetical protein
MTIKRNRYKKLYTLINAGQQRSVNRKAHPNGNISVMSCVLWIYAIKDSAI